MCEGRYVELDHSEFGIEIGCDKWPVCAGAGIVNKHVNWGALYTSMTIMRALVRIS